MLRAATWGEKWDLFKATHDGHQQQGLDISPRRPASYTSTPRRPLVDKARLPFLASASSDLDEGFEPSHDGDIESLLGLPRDSPRRAVSIRTKDGSKSLVGHTPSPGLSLGFDQLSLNPVRTSTPVYALHHRGSKDEDEESETSPGLPPYSVSDISHGLDTTIPSDPSTPRAQTEPLVLEPLEKWDARTEREMEALADGFYRMGMMGRCLDVWSRAYDWVKATTEQIDAVRNGILLRQMMEKWKDRYDYQLTLPATADRHRELYLQRTAVQHWAEQVKVKRLKRLADEIIADQEDLQVKRAWKRWRVEVTRRRTERWQKEVGKKERSFVRKKNIQSLANTFDVSIPCREVDELTCRFGTIPPENVQADARPMISSLSARRDAY